eukprot:TRINITY_DN37825_c0_g1_i2.p1 TRINITY_DN37825_c0_g1~~TRINITY_DN37825_c0_g1_i2.p1  ORF type:complete len:425 (-),score=66.74 TRINITY_DN37825_c0_g1_i2:102-1280(-)
MLRSLVGSEMCIRDRRERFLECRSSWLDSEMHVISLEQNLVTQLTKSADCLRTSMFEILSEFHAIFIETADDPSEAMCMLHEWAGTRIGDVLRELTCSLQRVNDSTLLSNILEQYMHCAQSLGRVGIDFRLLLTPIFSSRIEQIMRINLEVLPGHFLKLLQQPPPAIPPPQLHSTTQHDPLSPPLNLVASVPLSALTNYILTCLNDFRHCAPLTLAHRVARLFNEHLSAAGELLLDGSVEFKADGKMTRALMANTFFPYVTRCFNAIFQLTEHESPLALTEIGVRLLAIDQPVNAPPGAQPPPSTTTPAPGQDQPNTAPPPALRPNPPPALRPGPPPAPQPNIRAPPPPLPRKNTTPPLGPATAEIRPPPPLPGAAGIRPCLLYTSPSPRDS